MANETVLELLASEDPLKLPRFKPFLRLALCLLAAGPLFGANIVSGQDGNWSDPATWVGGVVPGATDQARVHHTVHVDVDTTVGLNVVTSESSSSEYAIQVQATNASTVRGHLIVDSGATLTLRGDVRMVSSNTTDLYPVIEYRPGSHHVFDSSFNTDPNKQAIHYHIYSASINNGTYRQARMRVLGTAENHVTFTSVTSDREPTNGVGNYHMWLSQTGNTSGAYGRVDVLVEYADIQYCGSQQQGCIRHSAEGTTSPGHFVMRHVTMTNTSGIKPQSPGSPNAPSATANFILQDVKTFSTITTGSEAGYVSNNSKASLAITTSIEKTTGTRLVEDCYFDAGAWPGTYAGFVFRRAVWNGFPLAINATNGIAPITSAADLIEDNVYRVGNVTAKGIAAKNVNGLYFYGDSTTNDSWNPHGLTVGLQGDVTINRLIYEYGGNLGGGGDPNAIWSQPYSTAGGPWTYQHSYTNNIILLSSYDDTNLNASGIGPNPFGGPSGAQRQFPKLILNHNTFARGGNTGNYAQTLYTAESGCATTGDVQEFKSNLLYGADATITNYAWSTHTGDGNCKITGGPPWIPINFLTPGNVTHNACPNCSLSSLTQWGAYQTANGVTLTNIGTVYNVPTSGTVPGANDLPTTAEPAFVDMRRNLRKWAATRLGGGKTFATTTVDEAIAYMVADIPVRVPDLFAYVSEGMTPTNPAYAAAAHDGTTIGAVQMEAIEEPPPSIISGGPVVSGVGRISRRRVEY